MAHCISNYFKKIGDDPKGLPRVDDDLVDEWLNFHRSVFENEWTGKDGAEPLTTEWSFFTREQWIAYADRMNITGYYNSYE